MLKWPIKPVHCLYMHAPLKIVQHFSTHFKVGMIIAVTGSHTYPQACTHARTHAHTHIHTHTHTIYTTNKQPACKQAKNAEKSSHTLNTETWSTFPSGHSKTVQYVWNPLVNYSNNNGHSKVAPYVRNLLPNNEQQWTQHGSSVCLESLGKLQQQQWTQ